MIVEQKQMTEHSTPNSARSQVLEVQAKPISLKAAPSSDWPKLLLNISTMGSIAHWFHKYDLCFHV